MSPDKPQTTRNRITGVLTRGETQLVFLDTPGAHRPRTRLGDYMVKSIGEAVSGVDAALLVVEPRLPRNEEDSIAGPAERELLEQLRNNRLPAVLAINKIDTLEDKRLLLAYIDRWRKKYDFARCAAHLRRHRRRCSGAYC